MELVSLGALRSRKPQGAGIGSQLADCEGKVTRIESRDIGLIIPGKLG